MKSVLVLALSLFAGSAYASCPEGDVQYWPTQQNESSWGGEGGAPNVQWVCHGGAYHEVGAPARQAPVYRTCTEGATAYFPDYENASSYGGEGGPANILHVCHHGVFSPKYPTATRGGHQRAARCPEGRIERFTSGGGEGSPTYIETYVCKGGQLRHVSTVRY